ncbi:MAG: hypothetical protein ABIZ81_09550 [Opitutaceae bacterium]
MDIRQPISVGNLLLDVSNYRIVKRDSQKEARQAIIEEQGRKLIELAKDIIEHGLNPSDLLIVIEAEDGNHNYIVIEGNRRLTALNLLLKPELSEGTPIHTAFKKLNKQHGDAIPKVLECVVVSSKKAGSVWIKRKHASGMDGAGTEPWSAMAKARADAEGGGSRPELDALNFVLTDPSVESKLRQTLQGSQFNITTLQRLVLAKDVQDAVGFTIQGGKIVTEQDRGRMRGIFKELVSIIATGKHHGQKFTERNVDTEEHRNDFLDKVLPNHSKKKKADGAWEISGKPKAANVTAKKPKTKETPSTEEQLNLIPKKFKLELPAGKINDIFVELKELDVTKRRHAVSVLFRIFVELTLDNYIAKQGIPFKLDANGKPKDRLIDKLNLSVAHAQATAVLSDKELKPISVATSDKNSFLSPETLNAYVHSPWMNPEPLGLKLGWCNVQLFIERLWTSKVQGGHP